MRFPITAKLLLAIGAILAAGLAAMFTVYGALRSLRETVKETTDRYQPLANAAHAMEGSITRASLKVQRYLSAPQGDLPRQVAQEHQAFLQANHDFDAIARTREALAVSRDVRDTHRRFRGIADQLIRHKQEHDRAFARLTRQIGILSGIAETDLAPHVNLNAGDAVAKQMIVLTVAQQLALVDVWIRGYLQSAKPQDLEHLNAAELAYWGALGELRGQPLTSKEKRLTDRLERGFASVPATATQLARSADFLREHAEDLSRTQAQLYGRLETVHALLTRDVGESRTRAELVTQQVMYTTALLIPLFILAGVVAAIILIPSITEPVRKLVIGMTAVGAGDLAFRLQHRSRDEFSGLTQSFNRMAAELEATTVSKERLERSDAQLRVANAALQEADRRKNEFLAMLAHELRNPLGPMVNAAEILRARGPEEPYLRRQVGVIARQGHHMARLLDDLLDVSRITRGKVELRRRPIDLRDIARGVVESARGLVERQGHLLTVSVVDRPLPVNGDATRLEQVIWNLLTNAAKYTPEGGRISLFVAEESGFAVLRVRDNGRCIAPEMLPRIFDLFTQVRGTLDRSEGGLGIGLTMARTLVDMHGGTVEARSDGLGQGTEFVVRLPLVAGVELPRSAHAPLSMPDEETGRRVLVVEDNVDAALTLVDMLEMWGHAPAVCHTGPAAVERVRTSAPEIVILDIGLPGMDGYEVARHLRTEIGYRGLLIALTGYAQEHDRRRSAEVGFDHHLTKPVDPEELRELLAAAVATQFEVPRSEF